MDMKKAEAHRVKSKFRIISGNYREDLLPSAMHENPRKATPEKGKLIMEQTEEDLITLFRQLE